LKISTASRIRTPTGERPPFIMLIIKERQAFRGQSRQKQSPIRSAAASFAGSVLKAKRTNEIAFYVL
jgi:hypothetical protein